jgi:mRNA-degrading endonuclease RelE of RelBE toxin-antitoxin system
MEFIETPAFTRNLAVYLNDDGYRLLQQFLMENPKSGAVIPDTGGLRKVRWTDPRRGKGKRGGLRVIYYYFFEDAHIWLLTVYDKDEADDLTPQQKKAYQRLVQEIRHTRSISSGTQKKEKYR